MNDFFLFVLLVRIEIFKKGFVSNHSVLGFGFSFNKTLSIYISKFYYGLPAAFQYTLGTSKRLIQCNVIKPCMFIKREKIPNIFIQKISKQIENKIKQQLKNKEC